MIKNLSLLVLIILSISLPLAQTSVFSDDDPSDRVFD